MTRTCLWLTILLAWGNTVNAAVLTVRGVRTPGSTQATLDVVLSTNPSEEVVAVQNDLLFDLDGLHLASGRACTINLAISDDDPACEDDPSAGPCKQLNRVLDTGESGQLFRGLILSLSNTTVIPDGVLYTCALELPPVLDGAALPGCEAAMASDPNGGAIGVACEVDFSALVINCGEVPSSVSFTSMEVRPARPQVGDEVELVFDVDARVFSRESVTIAQTPELLAGVQNTGLTFQGRAVQAGRANVRLAFTYATEEVCTTLGGEQYFTRGPSRTALSPDYDLVIAEAPTPTPTSTPVGDPSTREDNDGCQIREGIAPTKGLSWALLLVPAALAGRRVLRRGQR